MKIPIYIIFLAVLLSGCATSYDARGTYHRIQRGETIYTIAKGYGVPSQELAEYNDIQDPKGLIVGQKLYIPSHESKTQQYKRLPWDLVDKSSKGGRFKKFKKRGEDKIKFERGLFIWPVDGKVFSKFGMRNGVAHEGVDISAKDGIPVKAAANGEVVFSDKMRGYGNIIIIEHKDDYYTAYAHNKKNLVRKGKNVKQGDKIAEVGHTGRTTGPHLHFEVRHRQKPRNPLFFLPER